MSGVTHQFLLHMAGIVYNKAALLQINVLDLSLSPSGPHKAPSNF